ncbi:MAG: transcriptional repressor [candidate division Zixibacteria bacterium]|nr:transcriptional repressor [candidate division Zixibacteria bacterium]
MTGSKINRNSFQRDVILEELRKVKSHPSATALYEIVKKRIPNISLGTIYRNLELLSQKGIIQKLGLNGTEARFDGTIVSHYHISCTNCGRIDDIDDLPYENNEDEMTKIINGYQVSGCHKNFFGICPKCSEEEDNNKIK